MPGLPGKDRAAGSKAQAQLRHHVTERAKSKRKVICFQALTDHGSRQMQPNGAPVKFAEAVPSDLRFFSTHRAAFALEYVMQP